DTLTVCGESGQITGNVNLIPSNGTEPYNFFGDSPQNLTAGNYTFFVSDANGCQASANLNVRFINCIVPFYQPPFDTTTHIIGTELTQLVLYPNSLADSTSIRKLFVIRGPDGSPTIEKEVLVDIIPIEGQYATLLALLLSPEYGLSDVVDNGPNNGRIVTGFFPIAKLQKLDSLVNLINFARPSFPPLTNDFASTGIVNQGDKALASDVAKLAWKVSGKGIKVGVLSDSYNTRLPFNGPSPEVLDIQRGDLPGEGNQNYPKPVKNTLEYPYGKASDEGRAMLQIVHDVAPNAELLFRTGFVSAGNFAKGIKTLRDSGCKVIVDDITYFTEPFFKDGVIAQAVEDVSSTGVNYFTSAGNFGTKSYEGIFNPIDVPSKFRGKAHDFGGGDYLQNITFGKGTYQIALQWDDDFYTRGEGQGALNDLDIYLAGESGDTTLLKLNRSNILGDPLEILCFNIVAPLTANLVITRRSGSTPNLRFKYVILGGNATINQFNQGTGTVIAHANSASAMSVGAVLYTNTPTFGSDTFNVLKFRVASFSSRGGTVINNVDRQKPDFVGPNG
ncbi:MAG TPA: hypothetical protein PKY12_12745, partial [Catalimonadaceae bacterium]|nr:hypothetical protein [Catalimonadaceae bacterium]